MSSYIQFLPIAPEWLIWSVGILALLISAAGLMAQGARGLARLPFLMLLMVMLTGPSLRVEDAVPIKDVVAVVVDDSPSQDIGMRKAQSTAALEELTRELESTGTLDVRTLRTGQGNTLGETHLFDPLQRLLADVPSDRLAGVLLITDGQVHDVPTNGRPGGLDAPVHTLLTGRRDLGDRKLTVENAPAFGIVGQYVIAEVKVEDLGVETPPRFGRLTIYLNGEELDNRMAVIGETTEVPVRIPHAGTNILEIVVQEGPEELTLLNNRTSIAINGVRDRLKVLLVSGEPHAGQRTWRNLLKSDPAVDLVHFTILRAPGKVDFARSHELSLIEFPTDELFNQKLYEFDLIILDRFRQRRNVLNPVYFSNMARYVEQGGALLVAAGPAFATRESIVRTPLSAVLPVVPNDRVIEEGYKPRLTEPGWRHPVTGGLTGSREPGEVPDWGRWMRLIDADPKSGTTLMNGPRERPLLLLDRFGKGRVAMLMSDQIWLWARGFEGGGPQQELLRRLAHWLMKEPELEEEDLSASAQGRTLTIHRRTMQDAVDPVTVTSPTGAEQIVTLEEASPGHWEAEIEASETGLYRLTSGRLAAVAAVGTLDGKEFLDVRTSAAPLAPVSNATGGGAYWLGPQGGEEVSLPAIRRVRKGRDTAGSSWLGLIDNKSVEVRSTRDVPLLPPIAWALLLIGTLILAWRVEAK